MIYLYFYYKGKKYVMRIGGRIETIINYVFTKNYYKPALQASRGLRYKSIEERSYNGFVEHDMFTYTKIIAEGISYDLRGCKKSTWQPELFFDVTEKHTIQISL
jgi:hypothetical protein